jgi:hypothetical protein
LRRLAAAAGKEQHGTECQKGRRPHR